MNPLIITITETGSVDILNKTTQEIISALPFAYIKREQYGGQDYVRLKGYSEVNGIYTFESIQNYTSTSLNDYPSYEYSANPK